MMIINGYGEDVEAKRCLEGESQDGTALLKDVNDQKARGSVAFGRGGLRLTSPTHSHPSNQDTAEDPQPSNAMARSTMVTFGPDRGFPNRLQRLFSECEHQFALCSFPDGAVLRSLELGVLEARMLESVPQSSFC